MCSPSAQSLFFVLHLALPVSPCYHDSRPDFHHHIYTWATYPATQLGGSSLTLCGFPAVIPHMERYLDPRVDKVNTSLLSLTRRSLKVHIDKYMYKAIFLTSNRFHAKKFLIITWLLDLFPHIYVRTWPSYITTPQFLLGEGKL